MPGLEDLYREIILDHYKNPRNRGTLEVPPAHRSDGINPLCGDEIAVYLVVDDDTVTDVKIGGQGCSISQSSASMMSSAVKGKSVDEARKVAISRIQACAAKPKVESQVSGHLIKKITSPDIWKESDRDFRHRSQWAGRGT